MLQNNGMKNIENFHLQPLITLLFPTRRRASEAQGAARCLAVVVYDPKLEQKLVKKPFPGLKKVEKS
jgi:hypothetical protein